MTNTSCGVQTFVGSASESRRKLGRIRVAAQAAAHHQQLGDGDVLAVGYSLVPETAVKSSWWYGARLRRRESGAR